MNSTAKEALEKENTLMDILAAVAAAYTKATSTTPDDDVILGPWALHFEGYKNVNNQIIAKGGLDVDELDIPDILTDALANANKSGHVADGFRELFEGEKRIMALLSK